MPEPTTDDLLRRIAELEQQINKKSTSGKLSFKVSEKGAVSVYGLGRFPVSLYYEQWQRLLSSTEELQAFMDANKDKLKLKE
jgi:hypothetical protein